MKAFKQTFKCLTAAVAITCTAVVVQANTLKIAYDADPISLDMHEQLSGGMLQYAHMVLDPLVRWNTEHGFDPRLAEKYERLNDTTIRFHLRKGVKFHSGNEMTAKDVQWTFNRLKSSIDYKKIFEPFSELKIIDDYTVDLISKGPYPLAINTATYIFPLDSKFYTGKAEDGSDKSAVVKNGDSFASRNVSGTGPFIVTERQPGVKMVFKRNPNYWDTETKGNVSEIILTPIKEGPTRTAALLSGGVDFISPVPPNDMDRIEKSSNVELATLPGTRIITLQMNQDRVEAFKDVRVRQAIVHAINNVGIAKKIMKGYATPAAQFSPDGYTGHNPALTPRYDVKKAKQLMKEAGFENGFSITMMTPNNRYVNDAKIAQAVAAMLSRINIKVDLKTLPKAQYWPQFDERAADIMMIGWHSDTEDSANFTEFLAECRNTDTGAGQYNSGGYCNPEVDALLKKAHSEVDEAKRNAMLQEIEQKLFDDAAFIPLHWQDLAWAAAKNVDIKPILNVQNFPYLGDLVITEK